MENVSEQTTNASFLTTVSDVNVTSFALNVFSTNAFLTTTSSVNPTVFTLNVVRATLGLVAVIGNLLIVLCVVRFPTLWTSTNIVIANLAAADCVNGISMVLAAVLNVLLCAGFPSVLAIKRRLKVSLTILGFVTNNIAILYIALERFAKVKFALRFQSIVTTRRLMILLLVTWVFCLTTSILFTTLTNQSVSKITVGPCVIAATCTLLLYVYVCVIAHKKSKQVYPQCVVDGTTAEIRHSHKHQWKITKFLAVVLGVYFVSYAPWILLVLILGNPVNYCTGATWQGIITIAIWGINICVNPFIYVSKSEQFKRFIRKSLGLNVPNRSGSDMLGIAG